MSSRYYGNGFFRNIQTKLQAALINVGKVLAHKFRFAMTDIKQKIICSQAFHFMVDCSGDNIARGQFCTFIKQVHETFPVGQFKMSSSPRTASVIRNDPA